MCGKSQLAKNLSRIRPDEDGSPGAAAKNSLKLLHYLAFIEFDSPDTRFDTPFPSCRGSVKASEPSAERGVLSLEHTLR